MMITLKTKLEIEKMRTAGQKLAAVFQGVSDLIVEGVSTFELDLQIEKMILAQGLVPECKGYKGYPSSSCISINDVVVHGIPSKTVILKSGDYVKVDVVASYLGYCADMARGFVVGGFENNSLAKKIDIAAKEAFYSGIENIANKKFISEISQDIEKVILKHNFHVIKEFVGHGIGKEMHEEPQVPNFVSFAPQVRIFPGMTLAIEPMISEKSCNVIIDSDGWTARTSNGSLAGHYENTVLITDSGYEILTKLSCE